MSLASALGGDQRDARQQHRQLRGIELDAALIRRRCRQRLEGARFQQPVVKPEAAVDKVQQLHPISPAVEEQEQTAVRRIRLELTANDPRQAGEALSHVGRPGVGVNPQLPAGDTQHAQSPLPGGVVRQARPSNHFRTGESSGSSITTPPGRRIVADPEFSAGLTSIALKDAEASPGNRLANRFAFHSLALSCGMPASVRIHWYKDDTEMPSRRQNSATVSSVRSYRRSRRFQSATFPTFVSALIKWDPFAQFRRNPDFNRPVYNGSGGRLHFEEFWPAGLLEWCQTRLQPARKAH